jgi:major type 1 subunit fimbrin (pilin)
MNSLIKRAMIVAGVTTAMALPLGSEASDGTITFTGAVVASTCTVSVNGGAASATVTLPTVDVASLGALTTAAGTFFSMTVSGCTTVTGKTNVAIYFEAGPTVDEATSGLINTAASGSNVEVNLYNASGSTVVGTQINPGTGTHQPTTLSIANGGGEQWFYAGYSAAGAGAGGATAGAVSTQVTYSLVYS